MRVEECVVLIFAKDFERSHFSGHVVWEIWREPSASEFLELLGAAGKVGELVFVAVEVNVAVQVALYMLLGAAGPLVKVEFAGPRRRKWVGI